ncbi:MAG: glycosyltransferase [Desulfuromonadales bacterium]|nr:MAG: glycosyltransferase [Desulfuromonadales bacterium]
MKQLYVAWIEFQRRQISMAPHCGFELLFLPVERRVGKLRKLLTYLHNAWKTLEALRAMRVDAVWVQLPQVPLLWVALFYRRFFNQRATVIADCHNKMFRPPWSRFPLGISLLSRCDLVLVHNDDVLEAAVSLGVPRDCLEVVEDPPASFGTTPAQCGSFKEIPRPWLVFPASFAEDEPLRELLAAAAAVPDQSFIITGNVRNCREPELVAGAPANVHFVGFLSREEFDGLITGCDAVVALTRFDGIQLSVCGEAVGAGKPMLISDTSTLRRLFPAGGVFVRPDSPDDIASGARELMARLSELREAALEQRQELTARWFQTRGKQMLELVSAPLNGR